MADFKIDRNNKRKKCLLLEINTFQRYYCLEWNDFRMLLAGHCLFDIWHVLFPNARMNLFIYCFNVFWNLKGIYPEDTGQKIERPMYVQFTSCVYGQENIKYCIKPHIVSLEDCVSCKLFNKMYMYICIGYIITQ